MDINVDEIRNEIAHLTANTFNAKPRRIYVKCLNDEDTWHAIDTITTQGIDDVCEECYIHSIEGKA